MEKYILGAYIVQTILGFWFWMNFNLRERREVKGWLGDLVISALVIPNLFMFLLFVRISVSEFYARKNNKNRN